MAGITTHVLDTERGQPIADVTIDFWMKDGATWKMVKSAVTNGDGRTDKPMVMPEDAKVGEYQLEFHVADYLAKRAGANGPFVDNPVVRFSVSDVKTHYHVPMLCTPGSCTTYRGS